MSKTKSEILIDIKNVVFKNRLKIQKKLRKKRYKKKGLRIFRRYLSNKEYIYLKYFYLKLVKTNRLPKNDLRNFVKLFLKFDCDNIYFREYYMGVKLFKKYKKMTDKSFYSSDKRVVLDNVCMGIIRQN